MTEPTQAETTFPFCVELESSPNGLIRVCRSPPELEDLGQIEERVTMVGEQVRLRDEPDRIVGEPSRLVDAALPSEDFARTPREITCVQTSSLAAVLSLTEQKRSASW